MDKAKTTSKRRGRPKGAKNITKAERDAFIDRLRFGWTPEQAADYVDRPLKSFQQIRRGNAPFRLLWDDVDAEKKIREELFLKEVEEHRNIPVAAATVNLSETYIHRRMRTDELFMDMVRHASGKGMSAAVKKLHQMIEEGDSQALRWWLERTASDVYGPIKAT